MFKMRFLAFSIFTSTLLASAFGHALSSMPTKLPQLDQSSNLLQRARVWGSDDRKTFDEYAALQSVPVSVIEKRFAATGILECETGQVTAQLTESQSVITTSRHYFKNQNCQDIPFRENCTFYTHDGTGWKVAHQIDMTSLKMGDCMRENDEGDWAVLNLKRPAKGVRPYKAGNADTITGSIDVVNPAAFSSDFQVNGDYPRVINDCSILEVGTLARTTCDTGKGASGSANLREHADGLELVAIVIGTAYEGGTAVNISTPLKGDFYNAVMSAAGKKTTTAESGSKKTGN